VLQCDFLIGNFDQLPLKGFGMIHIGIAQTEIIDVFLTVFFFRRIPSSNILRIKDDCDMDALIF